MTDDVKDVEQVEEAVVEAPKKATTKRKTQPKLKTIKVVNQTTLKLQIAGLSFPHGEAVEISAERAKDEGLMRKVKNCLAKGIFVEV